MEQRERQQGEQQGEWEQQEQQKQKQKQVEEQQKSQSQNQKRVEGVEGVEASSKHNVISKRFISKIKKITDEGAAGA